MSLADRGPPGRADGAGDDSEEIELTSPEGLSERRWGILDALRRADWEDFQQHAHHDGSHSAITRGHFDER